MDFFKFSPFVVDIHLEHGIMINNIERSTWVERYSGLGEFTFEAKLSSGLIDFLPAGSIVSHIGSSLFMIVEDHQIKENLDEDPTIVITGRDFLSFLENRIIGTDAVRSSSTKAPYVLTAAKVSAQIRSLIIDHLISTSDTDDSLQRLVVLDLADSGEVQERTIEPGTLWERVEELLKIDDLGIYIGRELIYTGGAWQSVIGVYKGQDKSNEVIFSWELGDLSSVDYLFSQQKLKNAAMVVGQYVSVMVDGSENNYDRRTMIVDGSDVDSYLGEAPTGLALVYVEIVLGVRGQQALKNQNNITIVQSDISETSRIRYGVDYFVGDLVRIDGNFGQTSVMRVIEHAFIQDENGLSGHPTLAPPMEG